jgi:hypothetical protein
MESLARGVVLIFATVFGAGFVVGFLAGFISCRYAGASKSYKPSDRGAYPSRTSWLTGPFRGTDKDS